MDWDSVAKTAITAVGSGGSAFLGAFLRFKQRLKQAEDDAGAARKDASIARAEVAELRAEVANLKTGWRLEFDSFKEDYERDVKHREEMEEAIAEARESRPDPTETLRHEVDQLKQQLEKMKERQARYVRNETFADHVRGQESQWKEIARTLGRLETLTKA